MNKDLIRDVTVVYIGGYGRSGSTIFDILLGNLPGVAGVGELANVYKYWLGDFPNSCTNDTVNDFWERVRIEYINQVKEWLAMEQLDVRSHFKTMVINQILMESIFPCLFLNKRKMYYVQSIRCLYLSIAKVSGCTTIVDSSKTAWLTVFRPFMLHKYVGINVSCLHVLRNPYGVASSMKKGDNVKMETMTGDVKMPFPVLRASVGWVLANLLCYLQCNYFRGDLVYLSVNHEDFLFSPLKTMRHISQFIKKDPTDLLKRMELDGGISATYQFSGNRVRSGGFHNVVIRSDDVKNLGFLERSLCMIITFPVRLILRKALRSAATIGDKTQ